MEQSFNPGIPGLEYIIGIVSTSCAATSESNKFKLIFRTPAAIVPMPCLLYNDKSRTCGVRQRFCSHDWRNSRLYHSQVLHLVSGLCLLSENAVNGVPGRTIAELKDAFSSDLPAVDSFQQWRGVGEAIKVNEILPHSLSNTYRALTATSIPTYHAFCTYCW